MILKHTCTQRFIEYNNNIGMFYNPPPRLCPSASVSEGCGQESQSRRRGQRLSLPASAARDDTVSVPVPPSTGDGTSATHQYPAYNEKLA